MSRLDPLRERQDFLDVIEAERERQLDDEARHAGRELDHSGAGKPSRTPSPSIATPRPDVRLGESRGLIYDRDRGYRLRESEMRTLAELGKFHVVAAADLAMHAYGGRSDVIEDDVRNLLRQGLVRQGVFEGPEHTPRELLTLTKRGHHLLRASHVLRGDQAIYHGFFKPREANHDADLYKLYHKEIRRILGEGGRNPRVVLDFELRRRINRDMAKLGRAAKPEIARSHGLRVVRGRVPLPDVRIEYEKPGGEIARVDLELVTEHYHGHSIRDKVQAGFLLYHRRGEDDRLRRVLDGQELIAEILSL